MALIAVIILRREYSCLHFTDEDNETQTGGHCLLKNPMQNHYCPSPESMLSPGAVTTIVNNSLVLSMCSALCKRYLIPTMYHYPFGLHQGIFLQRGRMWNLSPPVGILDAPIEALQGPECPPSLSRKPGCFQLGANLTHRVPIENLINPGKAPISQLLWVHTLQCPPVFQSRLKPAATTGAPGTQIMGTHYLGK